ncbi:PAS domain-containing protein [Mariniflexile ostreae]|uniref:histidine kinase n=1 Tax=Mariniflexile ostreae TaxID=1520892 RepID=A0ABV5FDM2_9FLAO
MKNIFENKKPGSDLIGVNSDLNYDAYTSRFALKNSKIGVWDFHFKTNLIHYSEEAKNILGIDGTKINQLEWERIIHPEDLDALFVRINEHFTNKTPEYRSEHRVLCKKGNYIWIEDTGRIVQRDASGAPLRMIGTVVDITHRKERQAARAENLNIITNQNNRLQNFAHIVTHNLKEYAGNFESLLEFYDDAETESEKKDLITHLKTVSESLSKTIVNLNEIVSKQFTKEIERENLSVYQCIKDTLKMLSIEAASKKAVFHNNVSPDITIYANRSYLESIIQNLATNALKYAHPNRTPVVTIESHLSELEILTVTVTDNGLGIDLNKYGKDIFGLYRTFHGNENAEGVGLYLTKSQIETLGGKIEVSSKVNVGTTFTITMSIKKKPA